MFIHENVFEDAVSEKAAIFVTASMLQWNFNRYFSIFIHENVFENVVCEMAAILSQPQCDKNDFRSDILYCNSPSSSACTCLVS